MNDHQVVADTVFPVPGLVSIESPAPSGRGHIGLPCELRTVIVVHCPHHLDWRSFGRLGSSAGPKSG